METRRAFLYQCTALGNRLMTSKAYEFTTQARELQTVYDLADQFNYRQGDGYVSIVDHEGFVLNKIELAP